MRLSLFLFMMVVLLSACSQPARENSAKAVMSEYNGLLKDLSVQADQLVESAAGQNGQAELRQRFLTARTAYKKIEWLAEYYYPLTAKMINGPAIAEVEPDEKTIVVQPEGFQVIEPLLFPPGDSNIDSALLQHARVLQSNIQRLVYVFSIQETTDAHIFDALHLELFRIITLGITGFDSPLANNSLSEAAAALGSVQQFLSIYYNDDSVLNNLFEQAIHTASEAGNFLAFDRMNFIIKYLNPIAEKIISVQSQLKIPVFREPRFLKADAGTIFEGNIFNPDVYSPGTASYSTTAKVQLGKTLFYDNLLSGNAKRNCGSCHQPEKAFTDGLITSATLDGKSTVRRNTPTLLNAALQPALFYDLRVVYLEDQAKDVITNTDEMHGSFDIALKKINASKPYADLFRQVYKEDQVSEPQVKNALAAYIRSLVKMDSRFDQFMRGNNAEMTRIEVDGFNTFTGKGKCATCHFIPLFNGSNPPAFQKIDAEVIGVPGTADTLQPKPDKDEGRYDVHRIELHRNAFKTPTLRNIELTAPYMHNGVFRRLEEVIEFYNRGGGAGLGLDLKNQTLPPEKLNLTDYEKKALVAFMKTLTDN